MNIIKSFKSMEKELVLSIAKRESLLAKMPGGRLECFRNGRGYTWYRVDVVEENGVSRRKRTLIRKSNSSLAERLAIKGFNKDSLRVERQQLKAVRLFLKYFPDEEPGQRYIERNDEYMRLSAIHHYKHKYTEEEWKWMNSSRSVPQDWQKELIVPTVLDYYVRSKSESEYVKKFVELGIVFRYEWPTYLAGYDRPIFPDFRIMDTRTGEEYILEHFGRMDDPEYVRKNADKLDKYLQSGWLPGQNLFISYESKDTPFTSYDAEEKLRDSFAKLIRE